MVDDLQIEREFSSGLPRGQRAIQRRCDQAAVCLTSDDLQGKSPDEIEKFSKLFAEIQQQIDTKQLRPMVRTQYLRTAFQIPFDSTVRISLDTNLTMIKENPTDGPTCTVAGR